MNKQPTSNIIQLPIPVLVERNLVRLIRKEKTPPYLVGLSIANSPEKWAVHFDFVNSNWWDTFSCALGFLLQPLWIVLSRLTKRQIQIGYERKEIKR